MSTAFLFLIVAIGVGAAGSALLWLVSKRRRPADPDYQEQLRAIAPSHGRPVRQPRGVVRLHDDVRRER